MEILNDVVIEASPQEVFDLISDVERVVTCLPGAELIGRESENSYRGRVKVRVGPIGAAFEGIMTFLDVDGDAKAMHMVGRGADKKGNGSAEADIRLSVTPENDGARLEVLADLNIKGKFVQFGKGAISAVSSKIMDQFARNVQTAITEKTHGERGTGQGDEPGAELPQPDGSPDDSRGSGPGTPESVTAGAALLPPSFAGFAAVFLAGCLEGWILTRAFGKEYRHGR